MPIIYVAQQLYDKSTVYGHSNMLWKHEIMRPVLWAQKKNDYSKIYDYGKNFSRIEQNCCNTIVNIFQWNYKIV